MIKKLLTILAVGVLLVSCTTSPEDRGLYPVAVRIIGTPIVKTTLVDTLLVVGDTVETRHRDTLALSIIIR
jgi:hypothetical protein